MSSQRYPPEFKDEAVRQVLVVPYVLTLAINGGLKWRPVEAEGRNRVSAFV